jgi:hypothetical protein
MSAFLHELKRRKVVRVAAVYAATAFVVLQGADLILPALALPEWTYRMLVLLALFGLPIALVLGWAFELTPSGVRATTPAPAAHGEPLPALLGRRTLVVTALLVVLGIGLGAAWMMRPAGAPQSTGGPAAADRSVAVLPFDNYSPDKADAYFANGITEEITSQLDEPAGPGNSRYHFAAPGPAGGCGYAGVDVAGTVGRMSAWCSLPSSTRGISGPSSTRPSSVTSAPIPSTNRPGSSTTIVYRAVPKR